MYTVQLSNIKFQTPELVMMRSEHMFVFLLI